MIFSINKNVVLYILLILHCFLATNSVELVKMSKFTTSTWIFLMIGHYTINGSRYNW